MLSRMARICLHAFMGRYVNPRRVARERVCSCDSPIVSPGCWWRPPEQTAAVANCVSVQCSVFCSGVTLGQDNEQHSAFNAIKF